MLLVIYTCLDTIIERTTSNARHTIGDGDGGKAGAILERIISNARHTIGDGDRGKARAITERTTSNARHAVGDGDGGKLRAIIERIISNARHAVGDGDGGKASAITERITSNARHLTGSVHIGYFLRNNNIALIFVWIRRITATLVSNLQFRTIINVVVINGNTIGILNFNVVGTSYQW